MEHDAFLCRLGSLSVFHELYDEPIFRLTLALIKALDQKEPPAALTAWGELLSRLDETGFDSLGAWLIDRLRYSDAPWPRSVAEGRQAPFLEDRARRDVEALAALAGLDLHPLLDTLELPAQAGLSAWKPSAPFSFENLREHYRVHGCGPFARHRAFLWEEGRLLPVKDPDVPSQTQLIGYRRQRSQVEENTRALLAGKRVNNVLLFGDSGTGKSATVKSLLGLPDMEDLQIGRAHV